MKVCLIAGTVPPAVCGVGDYTVRLSEALHGCGVATDIVTQQQWGVLAYGDLLKKIRESRPDIIDIQYPTVGYRTGMSPHLLAILSNKPTVTTLHEFRDSNILRKLACLLFLIGSRCIVFTNEEDQQAFKKFFFASNTKNFIIRIGSNIPWLSDANREPNRICYFGIIRPNKGIEDFIDLAKLVKQGSHPYRLEIIGSPAASNLAYYQLLREQTSSLPIEWSTHLDSQHVAQRLRAAACAYLPFPDGVSMRRGSLLAVMGNDVPVVTTDGPGRSPEMARAMRFVSTPEEALSVIVGLMNDPAQTEEMVVEARKHLVDFSWPKIAEDHKAVYTALLNDRGA